MLKKMYYISLLCGLSLFIFCAHQASPSGGPDDTTGPTVISSVPKTESVNVPVKSRIIITFSEWLSTKSDRGVSIFPPTKARFVINHNRLEIIPATAFADSTTYHITINTLLKDLHNNPILSPISLTFSTGPSLDSGTLSGCAIDPSKKALQPKIALFKKEHIKPDSGFTINPDYQIQTDSAGSFQLSHIKKGYYHVVGYLDANSDNRIQPGTEQVYTPSDSLVAITAETKPITLFPAYYDTTRPSLQNVKAISNTTISGQWNIPFDIRSGYKYPQCLIERADTVSKPIQGSYIQLSNNRLFTVQLKTPLIIAPYRLIYTITSVIYPEIKDTITFNGVSTKDTVKPALQSWSPNGTKADLEPTILLVWSKPVTINAPLFLIDTTNTDTIILKAQSGFSDTTAFSLQRKLLPEHTYRTVILSKIGNDLTGNNLKSKDSTDTTAIIKFTTIEGDSLAISLQGGAPCLEKSNYRKWMFKPLNQTKTYVVADKSGQFKFDSIPSGKGLIYYFEDYNQNNKPDEGKLIPWIASEPFFASPDTVEARARWEVEGVEVNICDPCKKKQAEKTSVKK